MKLLSWMHRKFQGTRVNPCKEPPPASIHESFKSESDEKLEAAAAHYFLIRRKDSDEPWVPLKIASPGGQQTTAEPEKEKPHMVNNLPATPKKSKLPFSVSNCFHPNIADEAPAALSSLIEDQLGLLAIGTFGLREFADGELGDLEGFEMFVGTSESELRSKLNIPERDEDVCLPDSSEKQVLEIGEGVCAQGFRRDSPVFGEGELQVFGDYCWELRGASNCSDGGGEEDEICGDLKIPVGGEESKNEESEENVAEDIQEEGKKMLPTQTFLDSYNSGLLPSLRSRSSQEKVLRRIARFLGGKTQRDKKELPPPECPDDSIGTEVEVGKGKHELTKTTNSKGLAQKLSRLRAKSSTWIKPLTRLREQTSQTSKKALKQGKQGEAGQQVICTDVAFTCGPHMHPQRRKRSGRPQLRDLLEEPKEDRSTDDMLTTSSQEVCAGALQSGSQAEAPSVLESCVPVDQSLDRICAAGSHLTIDWASDGDDDFVSQSSDDEGFELNQEQWLKSDSEYFVLEL